MFSYLFAYNNSICKLNRGVYKFYLAIKVKLFIFNIIIIFINMIMKAHDI